MNTRNQDENQEALQPDNIEHMHFMVNSGPIRVAGVYHIEPMRSFPVVRIAYSKGPAPGIEDVHGYLCTEVNQAFSSGRAYSRSIAPARPARIPNAGVPAQTATRPAKEEAPEANAKAPEAKAPEAKAPSNSVCWKLSGGFIYKHDQPLFADQESLDQVTKHNYEQFVKSVFLGSSVVSFMLMSGISPVKTSALARMRAAFFLFKDFRRNTSDMMHSETFCFYYYSGETVARFWQQASIEASSGTAHFKQTMTCMCWLWSKYTQCHAEQEKQGVKNPMSALDYKPKIEAFLKWLQPSYFGTIGAVTAKWSVRSEAQVSRAKKEMKQSGKNPDEALSSKSLVRLSHAQRQEVFFMLDAIWNLFERGIV
jgi:hypothetical protein